MSRTDKQTPWWVKARQSEWRRHFVEYHDHRTGPCDLDTHLAAGREWVKTRCYIDPNWAGSQIFCACGGCSGVWYRPPIHRRARTAWRAAARQAVKTTADDRDGLDSPRYRRRSSW